MTLSITQWKNAGLLPASILGWYKYESGVSANGLVGDYSGFAANLTQASSPPILTANVLGTKSGWVFDGTKNPLQSGGGVSGGSTTVKYLWIIASASEAAFTYNRGLFSGFTGATKQVLASDSSGTKFFDFSASFTSVYRKNDVVYAAANQQAPMNGTFALIEVEIAAGRAVDGVQIGKNINDALSLWKGTFIEAMVFNAVPTAAERQRMLFYIGLEYYNSDLGAELYFPDAAALELGYEHFDNLPRNWEDVTQNYEYEDGGRTFNRLTDNPAREWQLDLRGGLTYNQTLLFDEFWETVGIDVPFTFIDKFGTSWTDVRVKDYSRSHEKHHWNDRQPFFTLIKYP